MTAMRQSLEEIIRGAGSIILSADDPGKVFIKPGDANFVTEYDIRVQEYLYGALKALLPEAGFLGEEDLGENTAGALMWVVDPIDGTTNFMHGYRESCVSVALCQGEETLLGMILQPYRDELFFAERGKGAFLNGRPIHVSDRQPEQALLSCGTAPYYRDQAHRSLGLLADVFAFAADIRRSGSAAQDMAYVACGRTDGFFEILLSPWDFAAGRLLVSEAGGIVTQFDGTPTDPQKPCSVLCGNPGVMAKLAPLAKKYAK